MVPDNVLATYAWEIFTQVNVARTNAGLPAMTCDSFLGTQAQQMAKQMEENLWPTPPATFGNQVALIFVAVGDPTSVALADLVANGKVTNPMFSRMGVGLKGGVIDGTWYLFIELG
jgi:hypothetical protein